MDVVDSDFTSQATLGIYPSHLYQITSLVKQDPRNIKPPSVLTHEEDLTIVGWIFDMQNCGLSITLKLWTLLLILVQT
jgi:hypothetical protein